MVSTSVSSALPAHAVHAVHAASQRTRIKICGITREEDLDAAVSAGADAVGFVMYEPSPRYVSLERTVQLCQRLPPFVTPVLLFVNAQADVVQQACVRLPSALLQFHGDETPQQCDALTQNGRIPYLRAARIPVTHATAAQTAFDLVQYVHLYPHAQAILLDAHVAGYGGAGQTFNWSQLPTNVNSHLVLSGGLTPANVIDGIACVRPRCKTLAVDVSSGVEVAKGIKSAEKIFQFVAAVRQADEQLAKVSHD